ncbi:MAG: hypothetical protein TREMPRED_001277 [Tremellales sp. Tagirdzhanova-0007]|nr:MAG: hypothetical protein TREMPRED_001277 [Tremellales sp. Tagirdzhanova-0007]
MATLIRSTARLVPAKSLCYPSRSISMSVTSRKDLVQDLYLNQLKTYKPAPQTQDAAASHVRKYTAPSPPKAPTLPSDLAAELSKFDAEEPVIGSAASETSKSASAGLDTGGEGAADYLAFLEKDVPKEAHH